MTPPLLHHLRPLHIPHPGLRQNTQPPRHFLIRLLDPPEVAAEIEGAHRVSAAASAIQRTIPPDSPERDAAKKEADDVSALGVEAFRTMWGKWPKDKRALVADLIPRFQAQAEQADAKAAAHLDG